MAGNREADDILLVLYEENGDIKVKSQNVGFYNLFRMCGMLQVYASIACINKLEMDLDDVKDQFWDIYLAAMETVEKVITNRKGDNNCGEKEDDCPGEGCAQGG